MHSIHVVALPVVLGGLFVAFLNMVDAVLAHGPANSRSNYKEKFAKFPKLTKCQTFKPGNLTELIIRAPVYKRVSA
jgi:hypothetical protein